MNNTNNEKPTSSVFENTWLNWDNYGDFIVTKAEAAKIKNDTIDKGSSLVGWVQKVLGMKKYNQ